MIKVLSNSECMSISVNSIPTLSQANYILIDIELFIHIGIWIFIRCIKSGKRV